MQKERHVAFICDDAYVMPTIVTIESLVRNAYLGHGVTLVIDVCTFGLSQENIQLLNNLSKPQVRICVHTIDSAQYSVYFEKIVQKSHVTPTSLLKFELPNIIQDADTLLYVDSDIIIEGNVLELFELNLEHYYLAASLEFWRYLDDHWSKKQSKF